MKDARACEKGSEGGGQRDGAAPASGATPTALSSDFAGTEARTDAARWSEGGCGPPKQKKKDPREEPPCRPCGPLEGHADEPHWPQSEPLDRDIARQIGGLRPPTGLWRSPRVEIELAAGTTFEDMPPISLYRNPHIMTCLAVLFSKSKKYICGKQYSVDHSEGFSMLENAIR